MGLAQRLSSIDRSAASSIGVAIAVVGGLFVSALGHVPTPAVGRSLTDSTVWVTSADRGLVHPVDATLGRVGPPLELSGPLGGDLSTVQAGSDAYVVDRDAGLIRFVDASRREVSAPVDMAKDGPITLYAGGEIGWVYAANPDYVLQRIELGPEIQPLSGEIPLMADGDDAVMESSGAILIPDEDQGVVKRATLTTDIVSSELIADPGSDLAVRLVDERPVVLDREDGTVHVLSFDLEIERECPLEIAGTPTPFEGPTSGSRFPVLSPEQARVVEIDIDTCRRSSVRVGSPGDEFADPIVVDQHLYIPNLTTNQVLIVGLGSSLADELPAPSVAEVPVGDGFELVTDGGLVVFNNRAGTVTGAISIGGQVVQTDKGTANGAGGFGAATGPTAPAGEDSDSSQEPPPTSEPPLVAGVVACVAQRQAILEGDTAVWEILLDRARPSEVSGTVLFEDGTELTFSDPTIERDSTVIGTLRPSVSGEADGFSFAAELCQAVEIQSSGGPEPITARIGFDGNVVDGVVREGVNTITVTDESEPESASRAWSVSGPTGPREGSDESLEIDVTAPGEYSVTLSATGDQQQGHTTTRRFTVPDRSRTWAVSVRVEVLADPPATLVAVSVDCGGGLQRSLEVSPGALRLVFDRVADGATCTATADAPGYQRGRAVQRVASDRTLTISLAVQPPAAEALRIRPVGGCVVQGDFGTSDRSAIATSIEVSGPSGAVATMTPATHGDPFELTVNDNGIYRFDPKGTSRLTANTANVTECSSSDTVLVPSITDRSTVDEADSFLQGQGFQVSRPQLDTGPCPSGRPRVERIDGTTPAEGTPVNPGSAVAINARAVCQLLVHNVAGLTEAEARSVLEPDGFTVQVQPAPACPAGAIGPELVNSSNPPFGAEVDVPATVTLIMEQECASAPMRPEISDVTELSNDSGVVQLRAVVANDPTSWSWSLPGAQVPSSTGAEPTFSFDQSGTFTGTVVASNAVGDSDPRSFTVTVDVGPPSLDLSVTCAPNPAETGDTVTWTANIGAPGVNVADVFFSWTPVGHGQDSGRGFNQRSFLVNSIGEFTVTATAQLDGYQQAQANCTVTVEGFGGLSCANGTWTPAPSVIVVATGVSHDDPNTSWQHLNPGETSAVNPRPSTGTGGWANINVDQLRAGDVFRVRFTHVSGETIDCSYQVPDGAG